MAERTTTRKNHDRRQIFELSQGICYLCGDDIDFLSNWVREHVLPYVGDPGTRDVITNMLAAHALCNAKKSDKSITRLARDGWPLCTEVIEHVCEVLERDGGGGGGGARQPTAAKLREALRIKHTPPGADRLRDEQVRARVPRVPLRVAIRGTHEVELARGGQAVVLAAAGERVVKRPLRTAPSDCVLREAAALELLGAHAGIVRMFGLHFCGPEDWSVPMLVLERLDCSLAQEAGRAAARGRSHTTALSSAAQVADALAYVHAHELLHRDLRPANVMVVSRRAPQPELRLVDFAAAADARAPQRDYVRTPGYRAPELSAQPVRAHTYASDVYALVATLREALHLPDLGGGDALADDPALRPDARTLARTLQTGHTSVFYKKRGGSSSSSRHLKLHTNRNCSSLGRDYDEVNAASDAFAAKDLCKRCTKKSSARRS